LLAEFATPDELKAAARRVRDAGFTRWDTHSPFPVHGIDEAMGIRLTRLPWIVFVFGALGTLTALLLVWWTNSISSQTSEFIRQNVPNFVQGYSFLVSGKPYFSLPAYIPVIFELTVLFAAIAAVIGMLVLNDLPRFSQPLLELPRFRRATTDRFFVVIEAADPLFDPQETHRFLTALGAAAVERIEQRPAPPLDRARIARWTALIVCVLLIPPALIAWGRVARKSQTRIHIIQDMDFQEKFKSQRESRVFADGRIMRPVQPGTVARGELHEDEHFYRGLVDGQYATGFPTHRPEVQLTEAFVRHGQRQYNIYCAPCHGLDGSGNGRVNQRALELAEPGWVQAASLYDEERLGRPVGHLYNTITNGIRTMPSYGDKLSEADRWAVVAYVRALQRSQTAAFADVPAERRSELEER
jgi:mono/diheme cytochrome c family protein